MLHLQEMERKQQQLMADYEARKRERREAKLIKVISIPQSEPMALNAVVYDLLSRGIL